MNIKVITRGKVGRPSLKPYSHAVCNVSIAPVRKLGTDQSEMTTQVLFGECVKIISRKNNSWMRIECTWDGYIGWVDPKQFDLLLPEDYHAIRNTSSSAIDLSSPIIHDDFSFPVVAGSDLINYDGISCKIKDKSYIYNGLVTNTSSGDFSEEKFIKVAKRYLHAPYLWGGRSPFGIDCSGLIQVVYKLFGVRLPRDAYQQAEYGQIVDFIESTRPGDLAFFVNKEGKIHHVGIMLDRGEILHASGMVRIDKIDHFGIYHKGRKSYTHVLRYIKRVFP